MSPQNSNEKAQKAIEELTNAIPDTMPGIPVTSCSTCEGVYDHVRERLAELNKENI